PERVKSFARNFRRVGLQKRDVEICKREKMREFYFFLFEESVSFIGAEREHHKKIRNFCSTKDINKFVRAFAGIYEIVHENHRLVGGGALDVFHEPVSFARFSYEKTVDRSAALYRFHDNCTHERNSSSL